MSFKLTLVFALAGVTALAGKKPDPCPRYSATVYVATSAAYGLTGDGGGTIEWIDGIPYTKYVDGQGGVEAYVSGGNCGGTFYFNFGKGRHADRTLNVVFQNWQNDGASGPPAGGAPQTATAGGLFLRGFSFTGTGPGSSYTTMMDVNGVDVGSGAVFRYEPMTSDYLSDNPNFPTYADINTPCETSAAKMTAIRATETEVTPAVVDCHNPNGTDYTGPLTSLLAVQKHGPSLVNVGQYGMDFRFRIVVEGWARY